MAAVGAAIGQGITEIGKVEAAKVMQWRAQNFTAKMMKNRHQWEVADLRAAGLNPILGYVGSKGGPPIGGSPVGGISGGSSIGTTALSAMRFKHEVEVLKQQAESLASSALHNRSLAGKALAETNLINLKFKEFPVKPSGIVRRLFDKKLVLEAVKKPARLVDRLDHIPEWMKQRFRSAAER